MAVVVAERHGLHAAATRFACAGGLADGVRSARDAALAVERAMLDACVPGATYGEALAALAARTPSPGIRRPGASTTRAAPSATASASSRSCRRRSESRWFRTAIEEGHALAWNPSVAGGGKAEDTYLVEADGLRRLTDTGAWPLEDGRPAVLDIVTGEAA